MIKILKNKRVHTFPRGEFKNDNQIKKYLKGQFKKSRRYIAGGIRAEKELVRDFRESQIKKNNGEIK